MKIGTFGAGNMARYLAGRWAEAGHEVLLGSRSPDRAKAIAQELGHGVRGGRNDEAAAFADVLLHTVRVPPKDFLSAPEALAGKVLIDLNNHDFPRERAWEALSPSLAERVQRAHPQARVVKAFNTMAMEVFDHTPEALRAHQVSAFLAGDDAAAVQTVSKLAEDLGLQPVEMGPLSNAWLLEAQGDFIRTLMFKGGGPMMTVSTASLPKAEASSFGGRRKGAY